MKRIVVILACLLTISDVGAQKKIIRNHNHISTNKKKIQDIKWVAFQCTTSINPELVSDSTGKKFYVFQCPGETADQLYKKAVLAVGKVYTNPSQVMSVVEGKMITINAYASNETKDLMTGDMIPLYIKYSYSIEFRDGRIKVNAPEVYSIFEKETYKDYMKIINMFSSFTNEDNEYKRIYTSLNKEVNIVLSAMDNNLSGDNW